MTTLYKVSTISEQILRFITRISELNDKIHEFQQKIKNLRFQYPDHNIEINGETIDQFSEMMIQKYHVAIANIVNNMLTYLHDKVISSEPPYYYPEGELSEQ